MAIFGKQDRALAEQVERCEEQARALRAELARLREENATLKARLAERQIELDRVAEKARQAVRQARHSAKNSKERAGRYKARLLKLEGKDSVV